MLPFINLHFIKIPMYGLCIVMGMLSGTFLVFKGCKVHNKSFMDFIIIAALVTFFSFIGAKLLYLLVSYPIKDIPKIIFYMLFLPKKLPEGMGAGFVFYGGMIAGFGGYFLGSRIAKCKFSAFFPELSFLIPLVHAFGRLGCFFGGCCYGILYEGPFAVYYHNPITTVPPDTGIFPVQILEAVLMFVFAVIIIIRYFKGRFTTVLVYFLYYSVVRFCLEYLRGDSERKIIGFFSTSQWISLAVFIFSFFLITSLSIYKKKQIISDNQ